MSCENVTRLGVCGEAGFRSANDTATNEENNIVAVSNPARVCLIEEKFISGRKYNNRLHRHGPEPSHCRRACCESRLQDRAWWAPRENARNPGTSYRFCRDRRVC